MASLRTRLLVAVLAITAAGLLLLGGITYFGQRSFLLDRLDDQIRRAPPAAAVALDDGGFEGGPGGGAGGPPPPAVAGRAAACRPGRMSSCVTPPATSSSARCSTTTRTSPPIRRCRTTSRFGSRSPSTARTATTTGYRVYAEADRFGSGVIVVAAPLTEVDAALNRLLALELLVIVGVLVVLGFVGRAVVRVGLLPLDRIGHTAGAIAGGDLSHRVDTTDPRTEVGRLGIAFNAMLDRFERAFRRQQQSEDRLRRFLADASHELRTPLASIRGYAELFRMGAASSPEEVAKAMRRIEDEAARMGILVEDLLTLGAARRDRRGAAHRGGPRSARGRCGRRRARDGAGPRDLAGGRWRTRRGAGRCASAAPGAREPVAQRVGAHAGGHADRHRGPRRSATIGVRLEVRDHGQGLPAGDPAALFERFWRAEGGRERGKAGAGLGLAIVAAIVDAHGGRVSAGDAVGGGAEFVVLLPRVQAGGGGGAGTAAG